MLAQLKNVLNQLAAAARGARNAHLHTVTTSVVANEAYELDQDCGLMGALASSNWPPTAGIDELVLETEG